MVRDDQEPIGRPDAAYDVYANPRFTLRGVILKIAFLLLVAAGIVPALGFLMGCWPRAPQTDNAPAAAALAGAADEHLFKGWPKPEVALMLSGEEHGYLQPCGCSRPQLGGLARRWNFLQTLKARGWPVVPVDVGDVAQRSGPQALLKYRIAMEARQQLGYLAVGLGQMEMSLRLFEVLGEFALNNKSPRVLAANLRDKTLKDNPFPDMVWPYALGGGENGVPKLGIVGLVGPAVAGLSPDLDARFLPVNNVVPAVVAELGQQQVELRVLLFQGYLEEARACVASFPQFHVILCLTKEEEPSGQPIWAGNTLIIGVGHKGRYVGVLGVNRNGQRDRPFDLHYELVALTEDYETPEGQDAKNPIHALLEGYAQTVKRDNYLAKYPQSQRHPVQLAFPQATYVGSEKCKKCHEHAYKVWKTEIVGADGRSRSHAHAYHDLEQSKRPSLRQYDGECVVCHVVGFGHQGGFKNEETTAQLKDVGCEVCHGPGSLHVKQGAQTPAEMLALMNPFKTPPNETPDAKTRRMLQLDQACQKCHDTDNDVHWKIDKWQKIVHPEPKQ